MSMVWASFYSEFDNIFLHQFLLVSFLNGYSENLENSNSIQILKSNASLTVLALASDRTNQMSKTYNDLDAILQLLQEVCSKAM